MCRWPRCVFEPAQRRTDYARERQLADIRLSAAPGYGDRLWGWGRVVLYKPQPTFVSLRNRNFRMYFAAQIGSNIGSWNQITAENWLVLQLTPILPSSAGGGWLGRGLALGITNALKFGPLVFLGLYG